jgi:cytochrome c oxidase subunit 2
MLQMTLGQVILAQAKAHYWMPPRASSVAGEVDHLFNFVLAITVFFSLLIFALMFYFAVKYRWREGQPEDTSPSHSMFLEVTWTIIPTILVLVIFYWGFRSYVNMTVAPPNAYEIKVRSWMWAWEFEYPNGHTDSELHIPRDTPIRLVLTSNDVIHSLYIPAFRLQKMTVPGRYNRFWLTATQNGTYPVFCAMYCGQNHSEMLTNAVVHDPDEFNKWLEIASNPENKPDFKPETEGARLVGHLPNQTRGGKGCVQCHTADGSKGTGPTFKDLFGRKEVVDGGVEVLVDEDYIRESILYPQKRVVKGYEGVAMPSYLGSIKDREIDWIISYLKTISSHYQAETIQNPVSATEQPAPKPN